MEGHEGLARDVYTTLSDILRQANVAFIETVEEDALHRIEEDTQKRIAVRSGKWVRPIGPDDVEDVILRPLLKRMVPERHLEYDTERINVPKDYVSLLHLYAERTLGEWQPEYVTATSLSPEGTEPLLWSISFTFRQLLSPLIWRIVQTDDWVSESFTDALARFATRNLSGDFVYLSTGGQVAGCVYLPRQVALRLNQLKQELVLRLRSAE